MPTKIKKDLSKRYEYHEIVLDTKGNSYMVSIIAMLYGKYTVILQPYQEKAGRSVLCETKSTLEDAYELFNNIKIQLNNKDVIITC